MFVIGLSYMAKILFIFFFEMAKILKELYIDVRQTFTKIQFFSGYIITFV